MGGRGRLLLTVKSRRSTDGARRRADAQGQLRQARGPWMLTSGGRRRGGRGHLQRQALPHKVLMRDKETHSGFSVENLGRPPPVRTQENITNSGQGPSPASRWDIPEGIASARFLPKTRRLNPEETSGQTKQRDSLHHACQTPPSLHSNWPVLFRNAAAAQPVWLSG